MAVVTGIERAGFKGRMVRISVDERLLCTIPESDFQRFPLALGEEIETGSYLDRVAAWQAGPAYEMALTMLDYSDRTERQILRGLAQKGILEAAALAVVERLKGSGLVDNEAYARRLVENQKTGAVGRYAVRRKLMAKGIEEETAREALEILDDAQQEGACREAARKLARRYQKEEKGAAIRKLSQALIRRGFSWDIVSAIVEEIWGEEP